MPILPGYKPEFNRRKKADLSREEDQQYPVLRQDEGNNISNPETQGYYSDPRERAKRIFELVQQAKDTNQIPTADYMRWGLMFPSNDELPILSPGTIGHDSKLTKNIIQDLFKNLSKSNGSTEQVGKLFDSAVRESNNQSIKRADQKLINKLAVLNAIGKEGSGELSGLILKEHTPDFKKLENLDAQKRFEGVIKLLKQQGHISDEVQVHTPESLPPINIIKRFSDKDKLENISENISEVLRGRNAVYSQKGGYSEEPLIYMNNEGVSIPELGLNPDKMASTAITAIHEGGHHLDDILSSQYGVHSFPDYRDALLNRKDFENFFTALTQGKNQNAKRATSVYDILKNELGDVSSDALINHGGKNPVETSVLVPKIFESTHHTKYAVDRPNLNYIERDFGIKLLQDIFNKAKTEEILSRLKKGD